MDVVFLDANVLFSAAYRAGAGVCRLWELEDTEPITSSYAVEEARNNLRQAEQQRRLERLLSKMRVASALPAHDSLPKNVQLPEKDRPILLGAIHAGATHLLTGDVRHFGRYYGKSIKGVVVLSPAEYLRRRGK